MTIFIRKYSVVIALFCAAFIPADGKDFKFDVKISSGYFSPSAIPLETIINRYFEWRGGDAYAHLQSFHAKSVATAAGAPQSVEIWMDRKGRWRQDKVNTAGIAYRFGASSDSSWVSNAIGQSENDATYLTFAQRMALIEFGDALRPGHGTEITLLGISEGRFLGADFGEGDDLKKWAYVQVSFGDSDKYVLPIDPETGALAGYIITIKGQEHLYFFGNWHFVDGVRMPFWRLSSGNNEAVEDFAISDIDLNKKFPESVFVRPPPSRAISFEGPEKTTGWINFTLEGGLIKIPVNINGHDAYAIVDNGTPNLGLDSLFAKSIGVNNFGMESMNPTYNSNLYKISNINGVNVKIGNLILKNLVGFSSDMSSISQAVGFPISLILGDEAFLELIVDIDFPNMRLSFSESPHYLGPLARYAMPLVRDGFHPVAKLSIEDRSAVDFMVDLGMNAPLRVFPLYIQSEPDLARRPWSSRYVVGVDGNPDEEKVITLTNIKFGDILLNNIPAEIPSKITRGFYPDDVMGSIGVGIFTGCRVILDYSRDRFYVLPVRGSAVRSFPKEHLGAFIHYEGESWVVKSVPPDGPAAKAGLKVGDVIVEIDGKSINSEALKDLLEGEVGRAVQLTLSGGEIKKIVLEEYY